jgi:hypothetical protein
MGIKGTDLSEVTVADIDGESVVIGDRVSRHLVLQVLRYYG